MESIAPEIELQLTTALGLIESVAKNLKRRRKRQPDSELEEEPSNVAELVKAYEWFKNQWDEWKNAMSKNTG